MRSSTPFSSSLAMSWTISLAMVIASVSSITAPAAALSTTGSISLIAAPASVLQGALESDTEIRAFSEVQNFALGSDLIVDMTGPGTAAVVSTTPPPVVRVGLTSGSILAGTSVDTYFLHLDGLTSGTGAHLLGSITFDRVILGVIALSGRVLSSSAVVSPFTSTIYETGTLNGTGTLDSPDEFITISPDGRSLSLEMRVLSWSLDEIRVVTAAIPEPSALLLLASGLVGLGFVRRTSG